MDLLNLPRDIFLIILKLLSPQDLITIRRVSKAFNHAFRNSELSMTQLLYHFPRSHEADHDKLCHEEVDWAAVFHRVARRHYQLGIGFPASTVRYPLAHSFVLPAWSRSYPVAPWQRFLQFENKFATFDYPDTQWTCDQNMLIFPSAELHSYVLLDLETRVFSKLDLESDTRTTRRISLKDRVLVIEWCEWESYHQLNEEESVYRHFATAYDVKWDQVSSNWKIILRNEWKIHFLGMPLNSQDRFFSTHNDTHYALYLWQPSRSAWGENEPIESLVVWNISSASAYRPSQDPTGKNIHSTPHMGVTVVKRMSYADLEFCGIRQRDTPNFRGLGLDSHHVYFIEENHRWMAGNQSDSNVPRLHEVKTTGIPFHDGPHWKHQCGIDGDAIMSFCKKSSTVRSPNLAPCWRHEEYPYLTIDEVHGAGVTFSARQCFMLEAIQINIQPRLDVEARDVNLHDELWQELLAKGKIRGNERWLVGENQRKEVVVMFFDKAYD